MGWTYQHRDKGQSNDAFFAREFPNMVGGKVVASATIGGTYYAAIREPDGETWALVVLTQWTRDEFNFGYKEMSESMGPCEDRAPAKVLDALAPTTSEYANEWRERCRARLAAKASAPKVRPGTTIRLAQPLTFTNGETLDTFTLLGRSTFATVTEGHGGQVYRSGRYSIPRWRERAFEVVGS